MPSRVIKDSIKTSRNVNSLSDFQFRLWIHLIVSADDYGRGNADPELIKNLAFPRRHGVTEKQLSDALHVLANLGMVILYEVDGEPYFYFPKWGEHQRIRQKVSKFPDPDDETVSAADCGNLPQIAADCGNVRPESRIQNPESRIQNPESRKESEGAKIAHEAVLKKWNSLDLGTVRGLSGTREQHLDARIRENGLDTVIEAIDRIRLSDFLYGNNPKGWKITFDWFLNPTNFQKVLEGNYDRKEPPKQKADLRDVQSMLNRMEKTL